MNNNQLPTNVRQMPTTNHFSKENDMKHTSNAYTDREESLIRQWELGNKEHDRREKRLAIWGSVCTTLHFGLTIGCCIGAITYGSMGLALVGVVNAVWLWLTSK